MNPLESNADHSGLFNLSDGTFLGVLITSGLVRVTTWLPAVSGNRLRKQECVYTESDIAKKRRQSPPLFVTPGECGINLELSGHDTATEVI